MVRLVQPSQPSHTGHWLGRHCSNRPERRHSSNGYLFVESNNNSISYFDTGPMSSSARIYKDRYLIGYNGCVRFASLGRPRCVAVFFFQDERGFLSAHVRPGKKLATHRGRPGELIERTQYLPKLGKVSQAGGLPWDTRPHWSVHRGSKFTLIGNEFLKMVSCRGLRQHLKLVFVFFWDVFFS